MVSGNSAAAELAQSYQQVLLSGDRAGARMLVDQVVAGGWRVEQIIDQLIWPTMESLQQHYRADSINTAQLNMATRLNRMVADQLMPGLQRQPSNGRSVLILCGAAEPEELGAQICADMFEAAGYAVRFAGGGVPQDEALKLIGEFRPHLLVLFGTLPSGMPEVRKLIDYLRDVNSCPEMQVMCCGGIYKRAEGLAEEIGADLFASDATTAVQVAQRNPQKRATVEQQTVGRMRRIRKAAAARKVADTGYAEAA
jgi:methanogenic corrinoid protein MtbC1